IGVRLLEGLAALGRLVVFDRQGIGLSDQPSGWNASIFQRWSDDIEAAVAGVGFEHPGPGRNLLCAAAIWLFRVARAPRARGGWRRLGCWNQRERPRQGGPTTG